MKKLLIPLFAVGAAVALPLVAQDKQGDKPVASPEQEPQEQKPEVLKLGSTVAEGVTLKGIDGVDVSFKELRGKVVILHFWSYRCPAEIHADPVFVQLEKHYADKKDVVIVGVCSNQGELGPEPAKGDDLSKRYTELREQAKKKTLKHPLYVDHGNKISDLFQGKTTPHCFVIDAKGVVQYTGALDNDPSGSKGEAATVYVRDAADALLAGKKVEVADTKPYG